MVGKKGESNAASPEAPKKAYAETIMYLVLVLAVIVVALAELNHVVQAHCSRVIRLREYMFGL